jgi:RHS repeat-associated protein
MKFAQKQAEPEQGPMSARLIGRTESSSGGMLQWFAALLMLAAGAVQAQVPADPFNYNRSTSYSYDAQGRLLTETVEPDNLTSCVLSTYSYDSWGNRSGSSQANCAGAVPTRQQFTARNSSADYSATRGKFAQSATNAVGQTSSALVDARFGAKTTATDIDGLVTNWQLDDFGRVIKETRADGTSTNSRYCYLPGRVSDTTSNSAGCETTVPADAPADAIAFSHSEPRDASGAKMGPYSRAYTDRQGRTLRTVTESFDGSNQPAAQRGALIVRDTVYSAVGTKLLETQPYYLSTGSGTTGGSQDMGVSLTQYDALGRPVAVYSADPRGLAGLMAFGASGSGFGAYGSKTAARTLYAYTAQRSTITNDRGQQRIEERNARGQVIRITDPAGGQLAHQYDAFANLVATRDPLGNTIQLKYDVRGRRVELNDPDAGLWKYDFDALGQLVWQQSANQRAASGTTNTQTTMAYDKLGRMIQRVEPEGTGAWSYDRYGDASACNKGTGRLCESSFTRTVVTVSGGTTSTTTEVRRTRSYFDNLGRLISDVATVTNGPSMATARSYSASTGRLDTKTYPTGVKVQYGYTALGYASQLKLQTAATVNPLPATAGGTPGAGTSLAAGTVLWQALAVNASGSAEQQQWSNGVTSRSGFEPATGRTVSVRAGLGATSTVLSHDYTWDSLNNLAYRADNIGDAVAGAVTETFEYIDGLSRLTKYTVAAPAIPSGSRSVSLTYNGLGMLLAKSDVGVYTYGASGPGAARPHALLSVAATAGGTTNYIYDANGNLISANGGKYRSVAYTSFNLPDGQTGITGAPAASSGGTAGYSWVYDENHQRIREVRKITGGSQAGTRTTWYLHPDNAGGLGFEHEINASTTATVQNPSATQSRHYLSFGGKTLGVLVTAAPLPTITGTAPPTITSVTLVKVEYWHKDHLGSLSATTDHAGQVTARYAYDPFGKRRYTNGTYDAFGSLVVDFSPATNSGTDRGYTEHEHLDDIGLIHMNGRIFDPTLGRFMQADPFIQAPGDLQNYNRYAYCLSNPLTCTDPTGFVMDRSGGANMDSYTISWNYSSSEPYVGQSNSVSTSSPSAGVIVTQVITVTGTVGAAVGGLGAIGGGSVLAGGGAVAAACLSGVACPLAIIAAGIYFLCDSCRKQVNDAISGFFTAVGNSIGLTTSQNQDNSGNGASGGSTDGEKREGITTPATPPPDDGDHGRQRAEEAKTDPNRSVGDKNRVIAEGRRLVDDLTGNNIYVSGNRVVITDQQGNFVTQFTNPRSNTTWRIETGRWIPTQPVP